MRKSVSVCEAMPETVTGKRSVRSKVAFIKSGASVAGKERVLWGKICTALMCLGLCVGHVEAGYVHINPDNSGGGFAAYTESTGRTEEVALIGDTQHINSKGGASVNHPIPNRLESPERLSESVSLEDKTTIIGYKNKFDENYDGYTHATRFLGKSTLIGHENIIRASTAFGPSINNPTNSNILGNENIVDGAGTTLIGNENEVILVRPADGNSTAYSGMHNNVFGDRNKVNVRDWGSVTIGEQNRINSVIAADPSWNPGSDTNRGRMEEGLGDTRASILTYGAKNTVGLYMQGREVQSGIVFGKFNRMYSDGLIVGEANSIYTTGRSVALGTSNRIGISGRDKMSGEGYALGVANTVAANQGLAVGRWNNITNRYDISSDRGVRLAFGDSNRAEAVQTVAFGYANESLSDGSVAMGSKNRTRITGGAGGDRVGKFSIAIGIENESTGINSTALGRSANSYGNYATAVGFYTIANGNYVTSVGAYNNYEYLPETDQWVKRDSGSFASALGNSNVVRSAKSSAVGYSNKVEGETSEQWYANAFGALNKVSGARGSAVGYYNNALAYGANAMGGQNNWQWSNEFNIARNSSGMDRPLDTVGKLSNAFGIANQTIGDNSGAYGYGNQVTGIKSHAFGTSNINTGYGSLVLGDNSIVGGSGVSDVYTINEAEDISYALVLGHNARTALSDGVALGSYAEAKRAEQQLGYDPVTKTAVDLRQAVLNAEQMERYEEGLEQYREAKENLTQAFKDYDGLRVMIQSRSFTSEEVASLQARYNQSVANIQTWAEKFANSSQSLKLGSAWQSSLAALSIGNEELGLTRQITGVAAGTRDTDAVNVAQLKRLAESLKPQDGTDSPNVRIELANGTNTTVTSETQGNTTLYKVHVDLSGVASKRDLDKKANLDGSNLVERTDIAAWRNALGITDAGQNATSIGYQANGADKKQIAASEGFNFVDGINTSAVVKDNGVVTFNVNPKLKHIESISAGDGGAGDTTLTLTDEGLDVGGKPIRNLGRGTELTDAATVGQLTEVSQDQSKLRQEMGQIRHDLSQDIGDSGALNAALSALKPLGYDPEEKTQFMAGIGRYKGSSGLAIGIAHHNDRDMMWNAGVAYSNHRNVMWNAGISLRFGKSNTSDDQSSADMLEMQSLRRSVENLQKTNEQQAAAYEAALQKLQADSQVRFAKLEKENEELRQKLNTLLLQKG